MGDRVDKFTMSSKAAVGLAASMMVTAIAVMPTPSAATEDAIECAASVLRLQDITETPEGVEALKNALADSTDVPPAPFPPAVVYEVVDAEGVGLGDIWTFDARYGPGGRHIDLLCQDGELMPSVPLTDVEVVEGAVVHESRDATLAALAAAEYCSMDHGSRYVCIDTVEFTRNPGNSTSIRIRGEMARTKTTYNYNGEARWLYAAGVTGWAKSFNDRRLDSAEVRVSNWTGTSNQFRHYESAPIGTHERSKCSNVEFYAGGTLGVGTAFKHCDKIYGDNFALFDGQNRVRAHGYFVRYTGPWNGTKDPVQISGVQLSWARNRNVTISFTGTAKA